ncbi:M23 family metallopeptidase [Nocardia sp. alder85J]|uniref:M23 family metallopeptidase n=1 Tax=Nocardia sp. alder85J TaxID=2862949 RepID=UPI001CD73510|nr:M23 family metallopeptidase [Nocardia sp. alder85J]MCX4093411.1 M23 family metallopeptidase [Nocardia sp. alder85J]
MRTVVVVRPDWRSQPPPPTPRARMRDLAGRVRRLAARLWAAAALLWRYARHPRHHARRLRQRTQRLERRVRRRWHDARRLSHTVRTRDWRAAGRDSAHRVRRFAETHRALLIGLCCTAILATADARPPGTVDMALEVGATQRIPIAYGVENQAAPESARRYLDAIDNGERIRESQVVAAASRATLERAKAEAAAAAAGRPAPWLPGPGSLPGLAPGLGGYALPARGVFTSGYGNRWGTFHYGVDIAAPIGSPIYAVADGTVIDAGPAQGFGLWVRLRHDDGTITVYGHMYDFSVSVGERVHAGQQIARVGNRGDSTGPHLHFEVLINGQHVDPQPWLALHGIPLS